MAKPKKNLAPKASKAEAKIKELQQKIQDPKYAHQKYESDSMVTIPGTLFADFLNTNTENTNFLIQLRRTLGAVTQALDIAIAREDAMTLNLMQQHIVNVDSGLTKELSPEEYNAMVNPNQPDQDVATEYKGEPDQEEFVLESKDETESSQQENPAN
jgi:hypothetical protein